MKTFCPKSKYSEIEDIDQNCFGVILIWAEWPSGLRRCDLNRKILGSNPTRRSAGLKDPALL